MLEQVDDSAAVLASMNGIRLPLSEEARASLAAVRAAQEAARLRARRETARTRAWFGAVVVAIALGVVGLGRRAPRPVTATRSAESGAPTAARASEGASNSSTPAPPTTPAGAVAVAGPAPVGASASPGIPPSTLAMGPSRDTTSTTSPGAAASAPRPVAAPANVPSAEPAPASAPSPVSAAEAAAAEATCSADFRSHHWRQAIESCGGAFQARPNDGAVALKVAKAAYARARGVEAGTWARRAIALDPTLAEAYVLIARADTQAGQPGEALDAYRHYLTLAPRGWHAPEARAAVRGHRHEEHARAAPKRSSRAVPNMAMATAPADE